MHAPIPYNQDPAQWINGRISGLIALAPIVPGGTPNLSVSTTPGGNGADTTEDILQSFQLPAGLLAFNGQAIRMRAWGVTANNTDVKTLRLYHGTTSFSITLTASSAATWFAEMELIRSGGSTQIARNLTTHGTVILNSQQLTNGSDNLSTSLLAKITGQASVGNANDIVCNGAYVELLS